MFEIHILNTDQIAHDMNELDKRIRYDFEINRNITVLRSHSATGKTTQN